MTLSILLFSGVPWKQDVIYNLYICEKQRVHKIRYSNVGYAPNNYKLHFAPCNYKAETRPELAPLWALSERSRSG